VPNSFGSDPDIDALPEDYGFALADLNGDGLVDLIRNHYNRKLGPFANLGGGEVRFNTGTDWGTSTWQFPAGPSAIPGVVPGTEVANPSDSVASHGSAFVDLDGDGILDFVQEEVPRGSWLNTTKVPQIAAFPDDLAQATQVTYSAITQSSSSLLVYVDDQPVAPGTRPFITPLRVVSTVMAENATGAMSETQYVYHSLRQDPNGRGPQGFNIVEAFDGTSKIITTTTYAQAYPYTGLPLSVGHALSIPLNSPLAMSLTTTSYCDSVAGSCSPPGFQYPPNTSLFVFPSQTIDATYLNPGTTVEALSVTTTNQYDTSGNPVQTTVSTTKQDGFQSQVFSKQTVNTYGAAGSPQEQQGKVTQTVVTSSGVTSPFPAPSITTPTLTHTTSFSYSTINSFGGSSATALALSSKRIEPGSGWPIELDTAYAYDKFGNLITTTSCASDFTSCAAGASNPTSPTDPLHHPPFRTTTTSYDPSAFNAPSGAGLVTALSYGTGRFPVKMTNALGQSELSAYDPNKGLLLQKTGPNGITTCYTFDDVGRPTSEIDRCGSPSPLIATTGYFFASTLVIDINTGAETGSAGPPHSKIVTVSRPAGGAAPTWAYTDDEGRPVATIAQGFGGGLIETLTQYNALNQVQQVSKPFFTTDQPIFTKTSYDQFNRVSQVADDLGVINGSGADTVSTVTTTYGGFGIGTTRPVTDQNVTRSETHFETKNALGKLDSVSDAGGGGVVYTYDSDGNLATTQENSAAVAIEVTYDIRGRKSSTVDPDLGSWTYVFDGFGDLVSQTDAKGQQTTMIHDALGRMISRTDSSGTAQWVYDVAKGAGIGKLAAMVSAPDSRLLGPCSVPYVTLTDGNRAGQSFTYDQFGQVVQESQCTDGDTFVTSREYDSLGRQTLVRYPAVSGTQLAVGYHYTNLGYLQYLTDESSDFSVLWQAKSANALGQITDEQMRNGVETIANRNPSTGWLLGSTSTAHADGNTVIQNWGYTFDEVGNLLTRDRSDAVNPASSSEKFAYDLVNRVVSSAVTTSDGYVPPPDLYAYDALGNLTQKSGSAYTYGAGCTAGSRAAGPHAVCTVAGGSAYSYDGDGNLVSGNNRLVTYNSMNRTVHIESDAPAPVATADFIYGAAGDRVVQSATSGGATARTVYVGLGATGKSLYERTTTGSTVQHVNFIYAGGAHGGNAFAVRVLAADGTPTASKYYNFDHLGSVTAVSDEKGHVASVAAAGPDAGALGYDPWGARRSPDGRAADPMSFDLPVGHREFTGHEQIPDVGLVNMNGRVYDPVLGRFLSPDPNVQFASDLQSYNRYSYVQNNPLKYTDPTGYFLGLHNNFASWMSVTEVVFGLGFCAVTGGAGCLAFAVQVTLLNIESSLSTGASFDKTVAVNAIGIAVGFASGAVVGAIGGGPMAAIIGGAASGAATSALGSLVTKQSLGWNVLDGAVIGAASAAAGWGLQRAIAVSQASAPGTLTGQESAGSGESVDEARARETAAGTAANDASIAASKAEADRALNDALAEAFGADKVTQALNVARLFGLPISSSWSIAYDQGLSSDDVAISDSATKTIILGPDAYRSTGWLGSSIGHELVHVDQFEMGNVAATDSAVNNINEIEAYDWELQHASQFYLTTDEVADIQSLRSPYINGADPYYITQALQGNYLVQAWDR
jgi:RHS repeat-associated protein